MHILLIHQSYVALDEPGGTRHHELACYLAKQGDQITAITSPVSYLTGASRSRRVAWVEDSSPEGEPGVSILRTYTYPALHRSFVHRLFSFLTFMASSFLVGLNVRRVDLVWGTSPPIFQAVTAWALARLKRVPFLLEVRDLWPAFAIGVGVLRQPALIRLSEWLERFLYRRADCVVVNSPGFIAHVKERGAHRVELLPNGADPRMFNPASDGGSFRGAHGLEGKFIALYAGAHGMSNDLGIVLAAASELCDRPDIAIVFVGDGKDKPSLVKQADSMGLGNVHFVPPIPKNEIPQALAAADACLAILKPIPLYATVYPNKVFDYMAAGRPVVLAIAGVIKEVVEAAGAGIAVPPGEAQELANAIRTLADDPQARQEMGRNGRLYVEVNFDRALLADRLRSLLHELKP